MASSIQQGSERGYQELGFGRLLWSTALLAAVMLPPAQAQSPQNLSVGARATIGNQVIELEVARTSASQALGLMFRETLADDRGMLFPFNPPQPVRFWMKNVSFPLDMIFLRQGEIRAIAPNVPPCDRTPCPTYGPDVLVDQVIELRGNRAADLGLKVGDDIIVEFLPSTDPTEEINR